MTSNAKKLTATTAATAAALLTFGLAGPAFATGADAPTSSSVSVLQATRSLADLTARLALRIDHRLAWIARAQARLAASTVLTAQQKADVTSRLAARAKDLLALKAAVSAATTRAALEQALASYFSGHPHAGWVHRHLGVTPPVAAPGLGRPPVRQPGAGRPVVGLPPRAVVAVPRTWPGKASALVHRIDVRNVSSNARRLTSGWAGTGFGGTSTHG